MMNKTFEQLNQELINKYMVFEGSEPFEVAQSLESIHSWGFIIINSCQVLPDQYMLYDNKYQLICKLDADDDVWSVRHGYLECKRTLFDNSYKFYYDLNKQAPVHTEDIKDVLLCCGHNFFDEDRIYVLKDGTVYRKKDGYNLLQVNDASKFYLNPNYKILPEETYNSNVDTLNDMIISMNRC